jgi:PAS domain S-box-containing protein
MITDKRGIIEYVNNSFERISGYSQSEAIGKKSNILKSGKHPNEFYKKLWHKILKEKKATTFKITNKRKNGELYDALVRISPILSAEGEVELFLGIQTLI